MVAPSLPVFFRFWPPRFGSSSPILFSFRVRPVFPPWPARFSPPPVCSRSLSPHWALPAALSMCRAGLLSSGRSRLLRIRVSLCSPVAPARRSYARRRRPRAAGAVAVPARGRRQRSPPASVSRCSRSCPRASSPRLLGAPGSRPCSVAGCFARLQPRPSFRGPFFVMRYSASLSCRLNGGTSGSADSGELTRFCFVHKRYYTLRG